MQHDDQWKSDQKHAFTVFWIIVTSETRPTCENKKIPNSQNIIVQKAAAMLPMVLDL